MSWTTEVYRNAKAHHKFALISNGQMELVTIRDAVRIWMNQPEIVFNTEFRIAGQEQEILAVLGKTSLANSITYKNFTTNEEYKKEIAEYKQWKDFSIATNLSSEGFTLEDMVYGVSPQIAKTSSSKIRGKSLFDKLTSLPHGKVLDVSNISPNGTGVVTRDKPSQRSKKYWSERLPIVSSDLEHYIMAIEMLPGGRQKYAEDVAYVSSLINGTTEIVKLDFENAPAPFIMTSDSSVSPVAVKGLKKPEKKPKKQPSSPKILVPGVLLVKEENEEADQDD